MSKCYILLWMRARPKCYININLRIHFFKKYHTLFCFLSLSHLAIHKTVDWLCIVYKNEFDSAADNWIKRKMISFFLFSLTVLSFIMVVLIHLVAQVIVWVIYFVSVIGSIGKLFSFILLWLYLVLLLWIICVNLPQWI